MAVFDTPQYVKQTLEKLMKSGYTAYLVGGCVRDAVIGRHVHDWDIATSASPGDVSRLFTKAFKTGEKFGTVTVLTPEGKVEVTTFRTEGSYLDGRRPESVEFVSCLDEDLSRRDFTMNAMAVSIDEVLTDPFGGLEDIKNRVIRCVGDPEKRFGEDALRMFRAYRFSAELGFLIERETQHAIYANADKARFISAERIHVELEKTLLSQRPEVAGEMIGAGLLGSFVTSCRVALEKLTELPAEPMLRWCAFCAILQGAGGIASASAFLRGLKLDRATVKSCADALTIPDFPASRTGIKRLIATHGVNAIRCAAAANEALSGVPALARVDEVIGSGECCSLKDMAVSGGDLIYIGHPPGKELGKTLDKLLEHVIEFPGDNDREVLLSFVTENKI